MNTPATLEEAAHRLAVVLRAENDCLANSDAAGAALLLSRKQAAVAGLQQVMQGLEPDRHILAELHALLQENKALLSQAMEVQGRIMDMVGRAARAAAAKPVRYNNTGRPAADMAAMAIAMRA